MAKIRVNLANRAELCEMSGLTAAEADAIVKFRAEHGPIKDANHLAEILGGRRLPEDRIDFDPAAMTAPESPGA